MQRLSNYVRTYRKKAGLSQRELSRMLGYRDQGQQVSRHEHFDKVPPLDVALRYEAIFHVPASKIFAGLYESAEATVQKQVSGLEASLKVPHPDSGQERGHGRKLQWLLSRRDGRETPHLDERASSATPHGVRPQAAKTGICGL